MGGLCCSLPSDGQNSDNETKINEHETIQNRIIKEDIRNTTSRNQTELLKLKTKAELPQTSSNIPDWKSYRVREAELKRKNGVQGQMGDGNDLSVFINFKIRNTKTETEVPHTKLRVGELRNHQNILTKEAENKIKHSIQKQVKDDGKISKAISQTTVLNLQPRSLKDSLLVPDWKYMPTKKEVDYINVNKIDSEYRKIEQLFLNTTKRGLVNITSIVSVRNSYLMGRYMLKKVQMERTFQKEPEETLVFHGTKAAFTNSICKNNFDWRKYGDSLGHQYGKGTSFSPISHYSAYYCDKGDVEKVMLVANVLICNSCIGHSNMTLPPFCDSKNTYRYDTSIKKKGEVIVKYSDDEYYPAYKITFVVKDLDSYYKKKQSNYRK